MLLEFGDEAIYSDAEYLDEWDGVYVMAWLDACGLTGGAWKTYGQLARWAGVQAHRVGERARIGNRIVRYLTTGLAQHA